MLIRLRWIYQEWRLGPEMGFPWFEEVFIKNPNTVKIRSLIRDEIMQVEGVTAAEVTSVDYDRAQRGRHLQVYLFCRGSDIQGGGDTV